MKLFHAIKYVRYHRWSVVLPYLFYSIFLLIIFNLPFPLKSSSSDDLIYINSNIHSDNNNLFSFNSDNNNKAMHSGNNQDESDDTSDNKNRNLIDKIKYEYNKKKRLQQKNNDVPERKEIETVILSNSNADGIRLLTMAFKKADLNKDTTLDIQELAKYINAKVREHIDTAIRNNPMNFAQIDNSPKDGLITWEEYHEYFLRSRGLDEKYIKNHSEDKHNYLDRKSKEILMKDKALWAEAARTDPFSLTLDEFLAFRHPESSAANLLNLVDDVLRQFDDDGDDHLTVEEFTKQDLDYEEENKKLIISNNIEERKLEFIKLIDRNHDKRADRSELLTYIDPRHPRHALQEAATLFSLSDANKDMKLTVDEMVKNSKIFLQSKMIDAAESFHDEF